METASIGMNMKSSMFSVQEKGMTASKVNPQQQETSGQSTVSATVRETVTYSPKGIEPLAKGEESSGGFERVF